jgi:Ras-related protein Rab-1A
MGIDVLSKKLKIDGQNIKLTIWDMANKENIKNIRKGLIKKADGVIFVCEYDNF